MHATTSRGSSIRAGLDVLRPTTLALALGATALLAGCFGGDDNDNADLNVKPSFVGVVTKRPRRRQRRSHRRARQDACRARPRGRQPAAPTAAELRKLAIYNNYRAIVPVAANGGYGTLFGPNVDVNGASTLGEGKVAGTEYIAYADDGTGTKNVTMMVQIPSSFNRSKACIVTATSSGSRGVYGAIGSAGEWGLKRGCVVAYTDKGSGNGVHDLATNTVNLQNGTRSDATAAGKNSNFTATFAAGELASFNTANPFRVAVKHALPAESEKDWGKDTLNAVRFAFWALNDQLGDRFADGSAKVTFQADNTIVIASSVSNGAGAALAAAEQDTEGLIDGIAVSEPNVQLPANPQINVKRGSTTLAGAGLPIYDYFTLANLYQPCASQSARAANSYGIALVLPVPALVATAARR
jgi:hydroxybutyrate-dimer hydrolase